VTGLAVSQGLLDQPGTVAFLVVFGMGVMLFFVFRSMSRHLRKVNDAARAAELTGGSAGQDDAEDAPGSSSQTAASQNGAAGPG